MSVLYAPPRHICHNHPRGGSKPAVPLSVCSQVIRTWLEQNGLTYSELGVLAGLPNRIMFDLYHGVTCIRYVSGVVSIDAMDKVITRGMEEPALWYLPPLDIYYTPVDEWTNEMKERHGQA